jgi:hypothetical protein
LINSEGGSGWSQLTDDEDYNYYSGDLSSGDYEPESNPRERSAPHADEDSQDLDVAVLINGLEPCQSYQFTVNNAYGDERDIHPPSATASGRTHCPTTTTTTEEPETTTDLSQLTLIVDAEVTHEEDQGRLYLVVTWQQRVDSQGTLRAYRKDNDLISTIKVEPSDEVDEDGYREESARVAADYCQRYLLVLTASANGAEANKEMHYLTPPNEDAELRLTDLNVRIENGKEGRGQATLSWLHDQACIQRYKVELTSLSNGKSPQGDIMVFPVVSTEPEQLSADLHMVPGMLRLKNCDEFEVRVVPFSDQASDLNITDWHLGQRRRFTYQLEDGGAPDTLHHLDLLVQGGEVTLSWTEAVHCRNVFATLRDIRYPRDVIEERQLDMSSSTLTFDQLKRCTPYQVEVTSEDGEKVFKNETFEVGEEAGDIELLSSQDVHVEVDSHGALLTWAERCGRQPYVIQVISRDEELEGIFEVEDKTELHLTNQTPCRDYNFTISQDGQLLYNGTFSTPFDETIAYAPEEFRVAEAEGALIVSWSDHATCIDTYRLTLTQENQTLDALEVRKNEDGRAEVKVNVEAHLSQCQFVKISLTPLVSQANQQQWSETNTHIARHFFFVAPAPPNDIYIHKVSDTSVTFQWTGLHCYTEYQVDLETDNGLTIPSVFTAEENYTFRNLTPCTQYRILVRSKSGNQVRLFSTYKLHRELYNITQYFLYEYCRCRTKRRK